MRLALQASRATAEEEKARSCSIEEEDEELAAALAASREWAEEEKQRAEQSTRRCAEKEDDEEAQMAAALEASRIAAEAELWKWKFGVHSGAPPILDDAARENSELAPVPEAVKAQEAAPCAVETSAVTQEVAAAMVSRIMAEEKQAATDTADASTLAEAPSQPAVSEPVEQETDRIVAEPASVLDAAIGSAIASAVAAVAEESQDRSTTQFAIDSEGVEKEEAQQEQEGEDEDEWEVVEWSP